MLPKKFRLSHERIHAIVTQRRFVSSECLRLMYDLTDDTGPKFACIVPKKTIRSAFERNRIKRLLRSALIELLNESTIPLQGVVFVTRTPAAYTLAYFKQQIINCLRLVSL